LRRLPLAPCGNRNHSFRKEWWYGTINEKIFILRSSTINIC